MNITELINAYEYLYILVSVSFAVNIALLAGLILVIKVALHPGTLDKQESKTIW